MKNTVKYSAPDQVLITVELDATDLSEAEQVSLVRLGKKIKVPGFRKGHAPVGVVAKNVDPAALDEEVINNAINKAVATVFVERNLTPLERPEVDIKKFVPKQVLELTAQCSIVPEVQLGKYDALKLKKSVIAVNKKDVDEVMDRIKQRFASKLAVDRVAKLGDEVSIDYVGKKDGVEFDGGSASNYSLTLGSDSFIPGFEQAIVGHKTGESFDIPLTFPEQYHSTDLAGAEVVFSVTVNNVNEITLPKEDDELAAKTGEFTTIAELRQSIENEIKLQREREAADDQRDDLIQQLVNKSKVTAPKLLVNDQLASIKQDMQQNLLYQGTNLDSYIKSKGFANAEEWEEKEATPLAEKRVKAGLVLNELAKKLKLQITEEQLADRIQLYKQQYANQPAMVSRFDEPEVQRDIANRLATELTVDALVDLNK